MLCLRLSVGACFFQLKHYGGHSLRLRRVLPTLLETVLGLYHCYRLTSLLASAKRSRIELIKLPMQATRSMLISTQVYFLGSTSPCYVHYKQCFPSSVDEAIDRRLFYAARPQLITTWIPGEDVKIPVIVLGGGASENH